MLIRFTDLVSLDLLATDGSRHRVEDVFVDGETLRAEYVVADIGGWFNQRKALVSVSRFGEPDVNATAWPCDLDDKALEGQPTPDAARQPDAMLAPEGGAGASMRHGSSTLRSVNGWLDGTIIHASDGEAGKLMGLIFDSADWRARFIVFESSLKGMATNQRVIEVSRIKEADFDRGHVTLSMTNDEAQKALDLHEVDGVEGKWYNKVMAYYGLQS
jgi:hypothetical protein